MIQCDQCEFFEKSPTGEVIFRCDPFSNIKEPECISKWQLIKTNQMIACYKRTISHQDQIAPLQEKMFKFMENELNDLEQANSWRESLDDDEDDDDFENDSFKEDDDDEYLGDPDAWKL